MKVTGAELSRFLDTGWPEPHDHWYWDHDLFENPDPDTVYDTQMIGPVFYQGDGNVPTKGDGYDLAALIRRWRKEQSDDVVVFSVPKGKVDEAKAAMRALGATVVK